MEQVDAVVWGPGTIGAGAIISTDAASVPEGASRVGITAERNAWPDTGYQVISCWVDISHDGGESWILAIEFGAHGGNSVYPDGSPCDISRAWSPETVLQPGDLYKVSAQAQVALDTRLIAHFL